VLMPTSLPCDWRELEYHPIADIFPLMGEEELSELVESIAFYDFDRDRPIVLYEGKILDGRNRHRALLELDRQGRLPVEMRTVGAEVYNFREYRADRSFDAGEISALDWSISVNLTRRHLDESQRAMIGAEVLPRYQSAAKERRAAGLKRGTEAPVVANLPQREVGKAREHAAKQLNVSPRSIQTAKKIKEEAPDLAVEVKEGNLSLNAAVKKMRGREEPRAPAPVLSRPKLIQVPLDPEKAAEKLAEAFGDRLPELVRLLRAGRRRGTL
jgi:alkylhydroperoxidase/carboxymuconolactone decarboxylase family protein YurZ